MKKIIISLMLCAVLMLSTVTAAQAALAPMKIGDADYDYQITINDATRIQRYLAGFQRPDQWYTDELYEAICDADGDGRVTILDATCIQRHLAALPNRLVEKDIWDYYIGDSAHHSTAELADDRYDAPEVAYVGVPVAFTAQVTWGAQPRALSVSVDGATVEQRAISGFKPVSYTCAFDTEGEHEVIMKVECQYGVSSTAVHRVTVEALPADGAPVVMGAAFFGQTRMASGDGLLTVIAAGGTAPYEYSYEVYTDSWADYDGPLSPEEPQPIGGRFSTGYIASNEINVIEMLNMGEFYPGAYGLPGIYAKVTVRDAKGRESEPVTVCYQYYELVA